MRLATVFLTLALTASCGGSDDDTALPEVNVPSDWIIVDAGTAFSLRAPQSTEFVPAVGIDSFLGSIRGPGFLMDFDYGNYSNSLSGENGIYPSSAQWITIDGKAAVILSSDTVQTEPGCLTEPLLAPSVPYHFVGVHVPDVGPKRSILERVLRLGDALRNPIKLTIYGCVSRPEDVAIVKNIFRTITFGALSR